MTTQAQKEKHKTEQLLQGYRNAFASGNNKAMLAMRQKYQQLAYEFDRIEYMGVIVGTIGGNES